MTGVHFDMNRIPHLWPVGARQTMAAAAVCLAGEVITLAEVMCHMQHRSSLRSFGHGPLSLCGTPVGTGMRWICSPPFSCSLTS